MSRWWVPAGIVGAGVAGVLALRARRRTARPPLLHDSLGELTPSTGAAVRGVLRRMRALGFDPVVHETYRTDARARKLARKGTGIERSMHRLGLAADIVDRARGWDAPEAFWRALGESAEAEGLVWGGRWSSPDVAHVQSIAVGSQSVAWDRGAGAVEVMAAKQIEERQS